MWEPQLYIHIAYPLWSQTQRDQGTYIQNMGAEVCNALTKQGLPKGGAYSSRPAAQETMPLPVSHATEIMEEGGPDQTELSHWQEEVWYTAYPTGCW